MSAMEASYSQPLSIESFSYSWLVNIRSSFESHGNSFRTSLDYEANSFIEMDPTMPPSKRFFFSSSPPSSHDFNFPTLLPPSPSSSRPLLHAHQLISNGYLIPTNESTPSVVVVSPAVKLTAEPPGKSVSIRKSCRRLSRQIFEKYLNFLRPICRRIQRVGGNNGNGGSAGSQITREAHQCYDEWSRRSCDSETSIYDAVLHCKNSIGK